MKTIYWHDYETFGSDPRKDRPCQFAGIRTDEQLNIIGDPLVIYCQPSTDYLPNPEACLITGITPQLAAEKGLTEAEFCASIEREFSQPGTCVAGYNSIRFDDEVTRHLLYRCFYDAYEREWKNGNSRWDIIDLLRLCYALRPDGIQWPKKDNGNPSFRLEELTAANGIGHEAAHDALSDVIATIEVAKLVKQKQPRLYDYYYQHRQKNKVQPMFNLNAPEPLLHISGMYSTDKGCMGVVLPLVQHPGNQNGIIVADLGVDPDQWSNLSVEEMQSRLFTPKEQLAPGIERVPLKTIHVNKCPALAPLSVLNADINKRYGIDLDKCQANKKGLLSNPLLKQSIIAVFSDNTYLQELGEEKDPDLMLYSGGFFDREDKASMAQIRSMSSKQLSAFKGKFHDSRLLEMLFRYRCRNYPDSLSAQEHRQWLDYCRDNIDLEHWWQQREAMVFENTSDNLNILSQLDQYVSSMTQQLDSK